MTTPRGQRIGRRNLFMAALAVGTAAPAILALLVVGDTASAAALVVSILSATIAGTLRESSDP